MLSFIQDAASKAVNSALTLAAKTDTGQSWIKSDYRATLQQRRAKLKARVEAFSFGESHAKLNGLVRKLSASTQHLLQDIESNDQHCERVAKIASNNVGINVDGILKESKAIVSIREHFTQFMNVENYQALYQLYQDLNRFEQLEPTVQAHVVQEIIDPQLVMRIKREQESFKLDEQIVELMAHIDAFKAEGHVKIEDADYIGLKQDFDAILKKHSKAFEKIRQDLVKILPDFFAKEYARLSQLHPEAFAKYDASEAKAVTPMAKSGSAKSGSKKGSVKARPATPVVADLVMPPAGRASKRVKQ